MRLIDIVQRTMPPEPWAEGDKIPWDEPGFSARMLREHLSQEHDAASRRYATIDWQVHWIHQELLLGRPTSILDLGCGPGLYASRLARLGHRCLGIDFSPASIAYAREQAATGGLSCAYRQADLRVADYGQGHGLAMFIYGEMNVFRPQDARAILQRAHQALVEGGLLLIEAHTHAAVRRMGEAPRTWYTRESGIFADAPYLCLHESYWDARQQAAVERYFIVDVASGAVTRHAATTQAYSEEEYRVLLEGCGFERVIFYPSLAGQPDPTQADFLVIVAYKGGTA